MSFVQLFPPLCEKIKIQIKYGEKNPVNLAHYYLHMKNISDSGENGIVQELC